MNEHELPQHKKEEQPSVENTHEVTNSDSKDLETREYVSRMTPEQMQDVLRKDEEELAITRRYLAEDAHPKMSTEERQAFAEDYKAKHLPGYIDKPPRFAALVKGVDILAETIVEFVKGYRVEGKEHIPESGPFLVIANHFGGDEVSALIKHFSEHNLHILSGKTLNWDDKPFSTWLQKNLGMIPIIESLRNLSQEERDALMGRLGKGAQERYAKVLNRSLLMGQDLEFVGSAVATLLQGDAVGIYPEGLLMHDRAYSLRKAYPGPEAIARVYERITGEELNILPVAVRSRLMNIGKPFTLSQNDTDLSRTEWVMAHLAAALPEGERGYYKEAAEKLREPK